MTDRVSLRRNGRGVLNSGGVALLLTFGIGCGVEGHGLPGATPTPAMGTGGLATGTGGQSAGTGGQGVGTGGQSSGTGGQDTGTGGQDTGTGGQSAGTGGQGVGTGGRGTGGQVGGTGGAVGTGGQTGASGVTIMINGVAVPKEKAIVFIHFGHSNMRGQANKPTSLMSYFYGTQAGLWSYQGGTTFVLAKEPTAPEGNSTLAGPGTALLKTAAAAVQASSGYQFISIGRGVGSFTSADYQKTIGGVPGALYKSFITDKAVPLKGKVTFGPIFIMLGITERHLPTAQQPGFPMRMKQMIDDIRADLGEPNLPVLFCDYEQLATGDLAPTGVVGKVVMPLVRMLPGLIPNLALVPTDGLSMQDDHHFDMMGHQTWAGRAIELAKTKGWFPWQ